MYPAQGRYNGVTSDHPLHLYGLEMLANEVSCHIESAVMFPLLGSNISHDPSIICTQYQPDTMRFVCIKEILHCIQAQWVFL